MTEDQLQLIWRISDEPVIALDGDTAGIRAAMRVIDLALPLLGAGKGLRFAILPDGQDPDDLIKAQGTAAMQAVVDAAQPMVRLLWRRETDGRSFDSPERKAALDRDLREALKKIRDPSIRSHYGEEIRQLRQDLFRPARPASGPAFTHKGRRGPPPGALPSTRASALASVPPGHEEGLREAMILAVVLTHPDVLPEVEHALERLDLTRADLAPIRDAILRHGHDAGPLKDAVVAETGPEALEKLFAERHLAIAPALRPGAGADQARACLHEELAKLAAGRGVAREVIEAVEDIAELADEGLTWRLTQAAEAKNRAIRAETEDKTQFDTAPSGARISRDEKAAFDALLTEIGKPPRKH